MIVVDDASEPPLPHLPGLTRLLRREGPRHLQAARNQGIAAATGDVVLLMDDDCLVRDDYVESHVWRHERDPGHLVVGSVRRIVYRGEPEFWKLPPAPGVRERRTFDFCAARLPENWEPWNLAPCSNNASVAREALLGVGGYDEAYFGWGVDDVDLTYRLMMTGVPLLIDSAIRVYHQEHPRCAARQAEEEARNLRLFAERRGFWVYDPPAGYAGPTNYPARGAWFHARALLREGEPAAIQVKPVPQPERDAPPQRWPLDCVLGGPARPSGSAR